MNLEKARLQVIEQNEEIQTFRDDTILAVAQMINCESQELLNAIELGFLTDDATAIISEASDCLYLLFRLFHLLDIDERAIEMKIKRNYLKYMGFDNKEQAISEWKANGGDQRYYDLYLDKLAED